MNKQAQCRGTVLIVDDELSALDSFEMTLISHGFSDILTCNDSREVLPLLREREEIRVMLLDLAMPHITGEALLEEIARDHPEVRVIVVTGFNEVDKAVECIRAGAFDYLVKPIEGERLAAVAGHALKLSELELENTSLRDRLQGSELAEPEAFDGVITRNRNMQTLFKYVEAVSPSPHPVLVTGETGVGKELIVGIIHRLSRRPGRLVAVNAAGLDDTLFSDTLFGHVKGAYTGAGSGRPGLIERAGEGTLFLDEVGDLEIQSQIKLLRLLQEQEYYPLGSDTPRHTTARVVVATCRDIPALLKQGKFRKDLFYRLQTHQVRLPSLAERRDDVPLLAEHFLSLAAGQLGKPLPPIPGELHALLERYDFPGNIRELESIMIDTVARYTEGALGLDNVRAHIGLQAAHDDRGEREGHWENPGSGNGELFFPETLPTMKQAAELLLKEALSRSGGNQTHAAQMLGISVQAVNQRLKRARERNGTENFK